MDTTGVLPHPRDAEVWIQKQYVLNVLRALPLRQRQVLALTFDDWTDAEIADLLKIEEAAVRSNRKKARRNAAELIGEEDS
jgi:RNA polymerase sigma-70 factor (ECF subfamily)